MWLGFYSECIFIDPFIYNVPTFTNDLIHIWVGWDECDCEDLWNSLALVFCGGIFHSSQASLFDNLGLFLTARRSCWCTPFWCRLPFTWWHASLCLLHGSNFFLSVRNLQSWTHFYKALDVMMCSADNYAYVLLCIQVSVHFV